MLASKLRKIVQGVCFGAYFDAFNLNLGMLNEAVKTENACSFCGVSGCC